MCLAACAGDPASGEGGDGGGIHPTTSAGESGDESGDGTGDAGGDTGGQSFDVLGGADETGGNPGDCPGGGMSEGEFDFSYIWIANSPEGTVSKIDTVTATEVARYRTGPGLPGLADPSRTSVSLTGDVVVLNRAGSATKITARTDECFDANEDGQITTSQGPSDVLPWGDDECIAWHRPLGFTSGGGPRAIAWDRGDPDMECGAKQADVWLGYRNDPDLGVVHRLDGETGEVEATIEVPGWLQIYAQGIYGGATDADGDFWVIGKGGTLMRIDAESHETTRWEQPPPSGWIETFYGMALDKYGHPWMAGQSGHLYRFDPDSETFAIEASLGVNFMGLAIDREGNAWAAHRPSPSSTACGVTQFDTATSTHLGDHPLPGCLEPVGVSVDVEGYVWIVDMGASRAYKLDPSTKQVEIVEGLTSPYTYSDMTGAGLGLVVNPPAG